MKLLKLLFAFCAISTFVIFFTSAREKVNYKIIPLLDLQKSNHFLAKTVKSTSTYLKNCPTGDLGCSTTFGPTCPFTNPISCDDIPPLTPEFTKVPCLYDPTVNSCVNYFFGPVNPCSKLNPCQPRTSHKYPCAGYTDKFGCRGGYVPGSPNCGNDVSCPYPP